MTDILRVPPQNIEAESEALGIMLLERIAIVQALPILSPDDFYSQKNRDIYIAISKIFNKENHADILLVLNELKIGNPDFDVAYLVQIQAGATGASAILNACKLIKDCSTKRRIIKLADDVMSMAYKPEINGVELMESLEKRIFALSTNTDVSDGFVTHYDVAKKIYNEIDEMRDSGEIKKGVKTGITYFDSMTSGGLRPGQVMILAAGTSAGKTAMAVNIAMEVAENSGTVAYFSYEMEPDEMLYRMISHKTRITQDDLRNICINDTAMLTMSNVINSWAAGNIKLDKTKCPTVAQIKSRCRKLKMECGLKLIVIDYIAQITNGGGNERERITKISREVKLMAMELQVPVLALSQLNRDSMNRTPRRPQMHDLKETSALEQDADIVALLYRPGHFGADEISAAGYNPNTEHDIVEMIITKHRQGSVGMFNLTFSGETSTFHATKRGGTK